MPTDGPIPDWLFSAAAIATIFAVMFSLGLAIRPADFRAAWRQPGLMLKGLFSVLVAAPAMALIVTRIASLERPVEIGIVLMAIAPGAPVALRRSLSAGGHRGFAPALQIAVALLAVLVIPLWIAGLDHVYDGNASVAPGQLMRQVFSAQLLPLGLGMLVRHFRETLAEALAARLARVTTLLLLNLALLALLNVWRTVADAGLNATLAIVVTTALILACGHLLGGPDPATRTALAVVSAARNPGLALLVAAVNHADPRIVATVLAYLIIAALTITPYVIWRRRTTPPR